MEFFSFVRLTEIVYFFFFLVYNLVVVFEDIIRDDIEVMFMIDIIKLNYFFYIYFWIFKGRDYSI